MRVLIDTNVLFSAVYRSGSVPHQAYLKAIEHPFQCLVCEQSFIELRSTFVKKFPETGDLIERFIRMLQAVVETIPIPDTIHPDEAKLRDPDDATILRAALAASADIIITGDLDFLESGIDSIKMISAKQFLQINCMHEQ